MITAGPAGRIAVVTGASRGLGRVIAVRLAAAGAAVALVARDARRLEAVAAEARQQGGAAEPFPADVSREEEVERVARQVAERLGPAGILVNNAGMNLRKPLAAFTLEEWNLVLATNLTSAFLMCRAFIPQMKGRGYGRIINVSSVMGHVSLPGRAAYSASKAGLLGMSRALALELAPEGISVVGISPGPVVTEMNTSVVEDPGQMERFTSSIPLGRWGREEEVAALALYLCSEEAAFITGTDVLIDGGWCAR